MKSLVRRWNDVLLLQYSFFGLPWIVSGIFMALIMGMNQEITTMKWVFIILAFFSARCAGMGLNRLIDCEIDAQNPRTHSRALPSGDIAKIEMIYIITGAMLLFFFSSYNINSFTFLLSPLIAALLVLYSYTKRVTSLCHFVLGSIHCLGPIVSFAAVSGTITLAPILLGLALFGVIAAGDIFYALQDIDFDREHGLYSIPAKFGVKRSVQLAHLLQLISLFILFAIGIILHSNFLYYVGYFIVAAMYFAAFVMQKPVFVMNSYAGLVMMLAFIGEYAWRK